MGALPRRAASHCVIGAGGWLVEERFGTAADLHQPWPRADRRDRRILCRCRVTGAPALVLGSSQPEGAVDGPALVRAGAELARRRSGGGAVVVAPDAQLWLDAWIGRDDPLWSDDVVRSAYWFGEAWATSLRSLGAGDPQVHRGRASTDEWSRLVCFAGLGPGEVTVEGRKVVGLAQRRSAAGALFHSMALVRWEPAPLLELLALSPEQRRQASRVAHSAQGLAELLHSPEEPAALLDAVALAVVSHLP